LVPILGLATRQGLPPQAVAREGPSPVEICPICRPPAAPSGCQRGIGAC